MRLEESKSYDLFKKDIDQLLLNKSKRLLEVLEKYLYNYPETEYKPQLTTLYFDLNQFLRIADFYNDSFRFRYERDGANV